MNNGDGTFIERGRFAGVAHAGPGNGTPLGDFDNDGDLDIYLANGSAADVLYGNNGNSNSWLHVETVGILSNRSGIGARVEATAGTRSQIRTISGGAGWCSQNSLPVEFGFGGYTGTVTVEIRWPSGVVQTLDDVELNQVITVTEE